MRACTAFRLGAGLQRQKFLQGKLLLQALCLLQSDVTLCLGTLRCLSVGKVSLDSIERDNFTWLNAKHIKLFNKDPNLVGKLSTTLEFAYFTVSEMGRRN